MSVEEKLKLIRDKCVELLSIAEKRTPGNTANNSAFAASCAGPAEAGWHVTIKVIDNLRPLEDLSDPDWRMLKSIICAWEGII